MYTGLSPIYGGLMTIPAAGFAWGLMWVTDRLYDWGFGLIAVPIRIIIFFMQMGALLGCLALTIGIVLVTVSVFKGASRGQDVDSDSALSVKGYMALLLLPMAMVVGSI